MIRLTNLVIVAAFAAAPRPPDAGVRTGVEIVVPAGRPTSQPDAHRIVGSNRPLDAADADAGGGGAGTPTPRSMRVRPPVGGRTSAASRPTSARRPASFHLRERPAHPANAPPLSA